MKAVIFGLDGVLVFLDRLRNMAWAKASERLGLPLGSGAADGVPEGADAATACPGKNITATEWELVTEEKNEIYRNLLNYMKPEDVSPETRQVLHALRERGLKLAIGSDSRNASLVLEKTEMRGLFDAVSDGNNIRRAKPDPEVFLKAAEYLGEKPGDCLVVDHSPAGIDAAAAGGFPAAGIGAAALYGKTAFPLNGLSSLLSLI